MQNTKLFPRDPLTELHTYLAGKIEKEKLIRSKEQENKEDQRPTAHSFDYTLRELNKWQEVRNSICKTFDEKTLQTICNSFSFNRHVITIFNFIPKAKMSSKFYSYLLDDKKGLITYRINPETMIVSCDIILNPESKYFIDIAARAAWFDHESPSSEETDLYAKMIKMKCENGGKWIAIRDCLPEKGMKKVSIQFSEEQQFSLIEAHQDYILESVRNEDDFVQILDQDEHNRLFNLVKKIKLSPNNDKGAADEEGSSHTIISENPSEEEEENEDDRNFIENTNMNTKRKRSNEQDLEEPEKIKKVKTGKRSRLVISKRRL